MYVFTDAGIAYKFQAAFLICNLFIFVNLLVLKSVSIAVFDWRKYLNRKSSLILGFQGHPTRI